MMDLVYVETEEAFRVRFESVYQKEPNLVTQQQQITVKTSVF